jgi:endonuclease G, mitochondrial
MSRAKFLIFLFLLGLFLYYKGKPNPIAALKHDVYKIAGIKENEKDPITINENDTVAEDRKDGKSSSSSSDASDSSENTSNDTESLDYFMPAKTSGEIVRHKAFILNYQEDYEQASWVLHRLLAKASGGKAPRSNEFMPDPEVSSGSAKSYDYGRSGYDKGHLCPAGDFKYDKELEDETFYMSNMSPQVGDFNRGIWNDMEQLIRRWAKKRGSLIVVTGPVLKKGLETIGRSTQIAVPEQYYKILYDPEAKQAIAILMPNKGIFDQLIRDFVVPIDQVEKLTGIDFFTKLPDSLEKQLETNANVDDWF